MSGATYFLTDVAASLCPPTTPFTEAQTRPCAGPSIGQAARPLAGPALHPCSQAPVRLPVPCTCHFGVRSHGHHPPIHTPSCPPFHSPRPCLCQRPLPRPALHTSPLGNGVGVR